MLNGAMEDVDGEKTINMNELVEHFEAFLPALFETTLLIASNVNKTEHTKEAVDVFAATIGRKLVELHGGN
jgi:hypothetical protein